MNPPLRPADSPPFRPGETPPAISSVAAAVDAAETIFDGIRASGPAASDALGLASKHFSDLAACTDEYVCRAGWSDASLSSLRDLFGAFAGRAPAPDSRAASSDGLPGGLGRYLREPAVAASLLRINPDAYSMVPPETIFSSAVRLDQVLSPQQVDNIARRVVEDNPVNYRFAPEGLRADREFALAAIKANPSNFDYLPKSLQQDQAFRQRALRANSLVTQQWSYHADLSPAERALMFDQIERSPSLLAGLPPEGIVEFLRVRAENIRFEHFGVLDDGMISHVIAELAVRRCFEFGGKNPPVFALGDVIGRMRPKKLFADPAAAAGYLCDPNLFWIQDPQRFIAIRNAVPPEYWANASYVQILFERLDIPPKSFPFALLSPEVAEDDRIFSSDKISMAMSGDLERKGQLFAALAKISSLSDLSAHPEVEKAILADAELVRALPLAAQTDTELVAYLVRRCPDLAKKHLLSPEVLKAPAVMRAYLDATGNKRDETVRFDYRACTLEQMAELAARYAERVTTDVNFLQAVEEHMSQGSQDAKEWAAFHKRTYQVEHELVRAVRTIGWRGNERARGEGRSLGEIIRDPEAFKRFADEGIKDILPGLDKSTHELIVRYGDRIRDLFLQMEGKDPDLSGVYSFLAVFQEELRKEPKLAPKLQAAIVKINQALGVARSQKLHSEWAAKLDPDSERSLRDYAKRTGMKSLEADDVGKDEKDPKAAFGLRMTKHLDARVRARLLAEPARQWENPWQAFRRALSVTLDEVTGLSPEARAHFEAALVEARRQGTDNNILASDATTKAITGQADEEAFVAAAGKVVGQSFEDYAHGLTAGQSLARAASPAVAAAYAAASGSSIAGAWALAAASIALSAAALPLGSLGYPAASDGRLVVEPAGSGERYYVDPDKHTLSTQDGLTIRVAADVGREGVERAVSSLQFLQECGLSFLRGDAERVLAEVRRTKPSVALRPEDGLDAREQEFLLSKLLPFFGVELPAGATLEHMKLALLRLNRGTLEERHSGLLLHLKERGEKYIDPASGEFKFAYFETAFREHTRALAS